MRIAIIRKSTTKSFNSRFCYRSTQLNDYYAPGDESTKTDSHWRPIRNLNWRIRNVKSFVRLKTSTFLDLFHNYFVIHRFFAYIRPGEMYSFFFFSDFPNVNTEIWLNWNGCQRKLRYLSLEKLMEKLISWSFLFQ